MEQTTGIRLLTSVTGSAYAYAAGDEVQAPTEIADDLVRAGHAEYLAAATPQQRAERRPSQQAARAEKRTT